MLAANPSIPADVLDTLTRDEYSDVVSAAAANPALPPAAVDGLAAHEASDIRTIVAGALGGVPVGEDRGRPDARASRAAPTLRLR